MDPGFLNDTTVYYNFPSVSKTENKRRSTLPRPHSSYIFGRSSSCPSSPKLSLFKPKIRATTQHGPKSAPTEPGNYASEEMEVLQPLLGLSATSSGHETRVKGEHVRPALSEVAENSSEATYQNVEANCLKTRKKLFFPWWKRKKSHAEDKERGSESLFGIHEGAETSRSSLKDSETSGESSTNYLTLPRRNSSCSSSTTLNDDEDTEGGEVLGERVLGGVSYVRPSKASSFNGGCDPLRKDLRHDGSSSSSPQNGGELSGKIGHWVREWRRKSRWLNKRMREKNPRLNGEGDVDIALIHCNNDTSVWADYLHDNFTTLLQDTVGEPQIKVEKINIESFRGYLQVPEVQASRINNAKLQIVILSPGFLGFLNTETELDIGKLLRPNRILALLLGVTTETLKRNSLALSSLYSFNEWTCLHVRDRDETFVTQVQEESLRLLTKCDLFDQCKMSSAFSVCPRKITQSYCKVYIHLKSPLPKEKDCKIDVTVGQSSSTCTSITFVQCHNPYTLSFDMPEKLLGVSCFLKVNLYVDDKFIGFREVKCEGALEILKDILKSAVDPTVLMCQALGICPASNELDEVLAQKIKSKSLNSRDFCDQNKDDCDLKAQEMPTWLHFSAFYGLENFTWALLDVPSVEKSLLVKNCKGHSPAKLALLSGYTKLAQDLENVVIVTSLALRISPSTQRLQDNLTDSPIEYYSPVPNPRPYTPKSQTELSTYDTPPYPRTVKDRTPPQTSRENMTSTPKGSDNLNYANLLLPSSPQSSAGNQSCRKCDSDDGGREEYLDMSGLNSGSEEYQQDISVLVDAWVKRNDAKSFLSEYEQTISKLKENLRFTTTSKDTT